MGKRYYCDVCDKSFADNPQNRKNHMSGVHHQRMRKAHYDRFRDPSAILSAELSVRPCRAFKELGSCDFGERCRFSHLTEERKRQLEQEIALTEEKKHRRENPVEVDPNFTVEDWLTKRAGKKTHSTSSPQKTLCPVPEPVVYSLPASLQGVPNLPPSLLPPPTSNACHSSAQWG